MLREGHAIGAGGVRKQYGVVPEQTGFHIIVYAGGVAAEPAELRSGFNEIGTHAEDDFRFLQMRQRFLVGLKKFRKVTVFFCGFIYFCPVFRAQCGVYNCDFLSHNWFLSSIQAAL